MQIFEYLSVLLYSSYLNENIKNFQNISAFVFYCFLVNTNQAYLLTKAILRIFLSRTFTRVKIVNITHDSLMPINYLRYPIEV